jgi:hypothetical protein
LGPYMSARGFREVIRLPPCIAGGSATYLSQPPVARWYFTDDMLVYTLPSDHNKL